MDSTPLQHSTNGDIDMVNGQPDLPAQPLPEVNVSASTAPLPSQERKFIVKRISNASPTPQHEPLEPLETPVSPSAPIPSTTIVTPTQAPSLDSLIPLPETALPGATEPVPTPALPIQNDYLPPHMGTEMTLDTSFPGSISSASALLPATTSPSKAQSPAPSTSAAFLSGAGGVASPARGSTPVPGAANNLLPSAIIPPMSAAGSPTRVYINTRVTPVLLEGLKWVARNEPDKPLKWLGEYLLKRSADVEGT